MKTTEKTEKSMEHESDSDTNSNLCARCSYQRIDEGSGGFGKKRTSGDNPNYSIVEVVQNIKRVQKT